MSKTHGTPSRRSGLVMGLLIGAALAPGSVFGDAISDVLSEADVRLELKPGQAVGRIQGVEDGKLRMIQRGGAEFTVPVEALAETPDQHLDEADRLASEGMFHRAAVQIGIARLLAPANPRLPALESKILQGLDSEIDRVNELREAREQAEAKRARGSTMAEFARACPRLFQFVTSTAPYLPRSNAIDPPSLQGWAALIQQGGGPFAQFNLGRRESGSAEERIQALRALTAAVPAPSEIRKTAEDKKKTAQAAVQLFLRAGAGLWIDRVEFQQYEKTQAEKLKSFKTPIMAAREKARELLREKLVPSSMIQKVQRGNLTEEVRVPVKQDPALLEIMAPRFDAPFVEETRRGTGIRFVTSASDEVFVPIDNWEDFDNAKTPPTAEEGFVQEPRDGLKQFQESADALAMAWGAAPDDPDMREALRRLEAEAVAVFRPEPSAPAKPASSPTASSPAESARRAMSSKAGPAPSSVETRNPSPQAASPTEQPPSPATGEEPEPTEPGPGDEGEE